MGSKHTPGPWEADGEHVYGPGRAVARASVLNGTLTEVETVTANARLIAAAPDMYEALRAAEQAIQGLMDARYDEDLPEDLAALGSVQTALAKAEGR